MLIEVLISLVIVAVGLLGLMDTQVIAQRSEMESYQRAQALVLLNDMVEAINTNRTSASCFAFTSNSTGTPYLGTTGTNSYSPVCSVGNNTASAVDAMKLWSSALKGAAETTNSGTTRVGAMVGARGCVSFDATNNTYTIIVTWQGQTPSWDLTTQYVYTNLNGSGVNVAYNCANGLYGANNEQRFVATTLQIASLQ